MNSIGRRPPEELFFEKVNALGVCWEWTASKARGGYGQFQESLGGNRQKFWRAHRWAWTFLMGPIPEGMTLDHLCWNKLCVNPDHMEVVTHSENIKRWWRRKYRGRG